jgi:protoporphyrinogen oxidase
MNDIILGAGVTGLAAGFKTGFPIYEATDKPGGICRSYYKNGYRFENGGGHWIFGADDDILSFINKYSKLRKYERKAGVYINKIFPYPVQSLMEKDDPVNNGSMKEHIRTYFGTTLCNLFFHPFNEKYTDGLYNSIIPTDTYKSPRIGEKGYNDTFYYPIAGLDDFIDKLAAESTIHYNKQVVSIEPERKTVLFQDGEIVEYDRLISTLPLEKTLELCENGNEPLPYTSVLVLNIGAERGPNCPKDHWLYVPYCKSGFFRVGFYSNVEPTFAPEGKVGIYVEKAYYQRGQANLSKYEAMVVKELQDWGFIKNVEIIEHNWVDCAYTWSIKEKAAEEQIKMLKKHNIESIGRYGKWKFQGIAQSITDGLKLEW